jgi:phosphoglycerate kinase
MSKSIENFELKGKRVFIRVDFNVPLKECVVQDDTRIRAAVPTIKYACEKGAKVILASHLGRPKGEKVPELSLKPIGEYLSGLLDGKEVFFSEDCIAEGNTKLINDMKEGEIVLLENLRYYKQETKNDPDFAKELAKNVDIYINDAFGTAHRAHASTFGVAENVSEKGCGYLLEKEINYFGNIMNNAEKPFIAILGGAKVSDKIGVIENLIPKCDAILIGGAMAYTFLKAKGEPVGTSRVEEDKLDLAKTLVSSMEKKGVKLLLPVDHVVAAEFDENAAEDTVEEIPEGKMGLDIGPKTVELYKDEVGKSATVIWNGPMGVFEMEKFAVGTSEVAKAVAASRAISIIGGGDSVAAINKFNLQDQVTHISTGGGAALEYMEGKELPGVAVLNK